MGAWKKIMNFMTSGAALIFLAIAQGVIAWPMSDHLVSYFWWSVGVFIGVWEIGLKVLTGKTLTQHVRANRPIHAVSYWLMNIMWLYFAVTLSLHFLKPVWIAF